MGITLKDVAEHANVSMSTVSRVLNQKGNISEETTQRVEKAISELMYKPSPTALRFSTVTRKIAVVAPGNPDIEKDGHQYGIDTNAILSEIEKLGHIPYITTVKYDTLGTSSVTYQKIEKNEVDGVIICDSCDDTNIKELCKKNNIPFISTNGTPPSNSESYVDYDNTDGAFQAIKYLSELGHKKIGIMSGPREHEVTRNRLYGVYLATEKLNLDENNFTTVFTPYTINGGEEATVRLLKNRDITAIFAFSDRLAVSCMATLKSHGIRVPDDISLIGFDDMEICKLISPTLSTVKRYTSDISPMIVDSLLKLIDNENIKKIQILYETALVKRESCKKLK